MKFFYSTLSLVIFGLLLLAFFAFILVFFPIYAIIQCSSHPTLSRAQKIGWIILIILTLGFGASIYFLFQATTKHQRIVGYLTIVAIALTPFVGWYSMKYSTIVMFKPMKFTYTDNTPEEINALQDSFQNLGLETKAIPLFRYEQLSKMSTYSQVLRTYMLDRTFTDEEMAEWLRIYNARATMSQAELLQISMANMSKTPTSKFLSSALSVRTYNPMDTFDKAKDESNTNIGFFKFLTTTTIPIEKPIELDGKTRDEILQLRSQSFRRNVSKNFSYKPFPPIFDEIQDGKPWWGWDGLLFYDSGPKASEGPSFRSISIANPFALLVPLVWSNGLQNKWNRDESWNAAINKQSFQIQPEAKLLIINVKSKTIETHYEMTGHLKYVNAYLKQKIEKGIPFDLEAVNARDLGYSYILLDTQTSSPIKKHKSTPEIAGQTTEFYHLGQSCGIGGGCNNLSSVHPMLQGYVIETLPVKLEFKLWHKKPEHFGDREDIRYKIFFE